MSKGIHAGMPIALSRHLGEWGEVEKRYRRAGRPDKLRSRLRRVRVPKAVVIGGTLYCNATMMARIERMRRRAVNSGPLYGVNYSTARDALLNIRLEGYTQKMQDALELAERAMERFSEQLRALRRSDERRTTNNGQRTNTC